MAIGTLRDQTLGVVDADALLPELDHSTDRVVTVINRVLPGEILRGSLVLLAIGIGAYLLYRIQEILFLLFLAVLLATAIEPLVNRLRRGPFNRGTGVMVVYTTIILILGVPAYLVLPNVASQFGSFMETIPERIDVLRPQIQTVVPRPLQRSVEGALDQIGGGLRSPAAPAQDQIVQAGQTAAHTVLSFFSVFVLAFYWLLERASIKRIILRTVRPQDARSVNTVWLEVEEKLGGWVRGQLMLMLAIGVMAGIGYTVIGLPNAVLLAVMAGLLEIIPMIGPFLAFTPAVIVGLFIDPSHAVIVAVYALIIQQIESNILVPRVMGHTVGVSPLTVLLGILVGSSLAELPGAFLAVPIAGAAQVIVAHLLRSEDPSQAEVHIPRERLPQQQGGKGEIAAPDPRPIS